MEIGLKIKKINPSRAMCNISLEREQKILSGKNEEKPKGLTNFLPPIWVLPAKKLRAKKIFPKNGQPTGVSFRPYKVGHPSCAVCME